MDEDLRPESPCVKCGGELRSGAEFCPHCGRVVGHQDQSPSANQPRNGFRWSLFTGWVLVVVGLVGLGIAGISLLSIALRDGAVVDRVEVSGRQATNGETPAAVLHTPNVLDLSIDRAMERLTQAGVDEDRIDVDRVTSPMGDGIVLDQVPRPGEILEADVSLTVAEGSSAMPDVVGVDLRLALDVLAETGMDRSRIATEQRPFATVADIVLEQSPRPGTADPANVVLVIAVPPSAPNITGLAVEDADALLREIGAELLIEAEQSLDGQAGTVLSQATPPGTPLEGPLRAFVAQEPESAQLLSLSFDDWSRCASSDVTVAGRTHSDGFLCESTASSESWMRVDLPVGAQRFRAEAALSADSTASELFVVVYADGSAVDLITISRGQTVSFDSDIAGARQLEIRVSTGSGTIVLGDARVVAAPGRSL